MVQLWGWIQCSDDLTCWACVGWTAPHDNELVLCTGYAASDDLHKKHSEDYRHVPRHHAGPPPDWPPPAPIVGDYRWPGPHYHYHQLDGRKLEPPTPAQQWFWLSR
jgi:hypothetical protein